MSKLILFAILMSAAAFAQQRGMYGGVSTGQMVGVVNDPGFGSRLGATVSGLPQTGSVIPIQGVTPGGIYGGGGNRGGGNWQQPRGGNRTVVVPYGVPVGYPVPVYEPAPQQAQPAPTVVINQYFTNDSEDHRHVQPAHGPAQAAATPAPAPAPAPAPRPAAQRAAEERATITMLAFADSSVVSAIAYWTQDDTLHYITKNYEKKTVPVALLDKAATTQLNGERNIEFRLESIR